MEETFKEYFAFRVDRFYGVCPNISEKCSKNCCWVDVCVRHQKDFVGKYGCYVCLSCKHEINGKESAPSRFSVFFAEEYKRSFLNLKDITSYWEICE